MNKNLIENLFLPYGLSKTAKELGFNEPCFAYYQHIKESDKNVSFLIKERDKYTDLVEKQGDVIFVSAPTHQQLINWLREKHGIKINPTGFFKNIHSFEIRKVGTKEGRELIRICDEGLSYQDAQNKAIEEALKLVKDEIITN